MKLAFPAAYESFITVTIFAVLGMAGWYVNETYGTTHKRAVTFGAFRDVVAMLTVCGIAYRLWSVRLPQWMVLLVLAWALAQAVSAAKSVRKALDTGLGSDDEAYVTASSVPAGAQRLRFGPHELIMDHDRLMTRRHYAAHDLRGHVGAVAFALVLFLVCCVTMGHLSAMTFVLLFGYAAATIVGETMKLSRLRLLIQVRGNRIFAEGNDRGRIGDAEIDVIDAKTFQNIRLVDKSPWMPLVLVTTKTAPPQQVEEIAEAIRAFLKQRQAEQVWPPAPEVGLRA